MNCKRCGERGAERMQVQFRSDATVLVYLCRRCAESMLVDDEISELVPAAG